jgi:predicted PurR-regulated permease PerM
MKFKWDKRYLYAGVTAFLVIVACIVFFWALSRAADIRTVLKLMGTALSPITYGLVIAYLMNKPVMLLETRLLPKISKKLFKSGGKKEQRFLRASSIVLAFLLALVLIGSILAIILPQLYYSLEGLIRNAQSYIDTVVNWIDGLFSGDSDMESTALNIVSSVTDYFTNWLENSVLPQMDSIILNVSNGVLTTVKTFLNVFIGIIVSIYVLYSKETFSAQAKKLLYGAFPSKYINKLMDWLTHFHETFGNFISGKLLDSLIIGVLCFIILAIAQIPYASLVSVIVGITNMIPFFGPFIGAVPSAFLIFLEDPLKCLIFIIIIIVLQQFDGNILGPKIIGNVTGLSGFWVMFSILFFGQLFGFVGMIIGVPLFAVIYDQIRSFVENRLKKKDLPHTTEEFKDISRIDPDTNSPVYREAAEPPMTIRDRIRKKGEKNDGNDISE